MMAHGFDEYRVFIAAPGDMEADRQACYDAVAQVDAEVAMPEKILLVSVGLRENGQLESHRSIVSDNVRWSSFFIQLFEDEWGPRELYRKLFLLAVECRNDPAMPMRDVVVCLKKAPQETDARVLAWRRELGERRDVRVIEYGSAEEVQARLEEVCAGWTRELIAAGAGAPCVAQG